MSENNNIPRHWQVKKLGEVCQVLDNLRKPINSAERQQRIAGKKQSELFQYYGATGQVGWIDDYITDGQYILIGEDGAPFLDIFKDKAYKISGKTWVNNHAHILKGKENLISDEFVLYHLNSIDYANFVNGTTRLKLTKSSLVEIPIFLPPLPEQLAIVSKIEELLSDLENGKQQLLTAQQQLKVYRQSLLKATFEGRLTNEGVKEGELPKGWSQVKMSDLVEKPQYGTSKKCDYLSNGIGVLRIPNIVNGVVDCTDLKFAQFDNCERENYRLKDGDILTIRSNGSVDLVGKCALIQKKDERFLYAGYLIKLRPKINLVLPKYLLYVLSSTNLRNQIEFKARSTSGVNNINSEELKSLIIPLCTLSEQHQIVEVLESKLAICDKIESTISQGLQQAETLKQSILKKAFEGKLV